MVILSFSLAQVPWGLAVSGAEPTQIGEWDDCEGQTREYCDR